jgi:hypothetical protein
MPQSYGDADLRQLPQSRHTIASHRDTQRCAPWQLRSACYTWCSPRAAGGGPYCGPELVQSPRVANRVRAGRQQR